MDTDTRPLTGSLIGSFVHSEWPDNGYRHSAITGSLMGSFVHSEWADNGYRHSAVTGSLMGSFVQSEWPDNGYRHSPISGSLRVSSTQSGQTMYRHSDIISSLIGTHEGRSMHKETFLLGNFRS